ncbi:hypothetical protein [Glaciecola sp. KUL10]|uniref:hypothetical protein n=1 Tax=Glaciecola sp. (strain KUL10) TaxID=2161813 RepID=UPI000D78AB99|nr:hypothetical protein [Glaciecola sp. KUL10]
MHKVDINRHTLSLSNFLFLALSVFLFYAWFNLLFTTETLIDPANLPKSKVIRYQGLVFGYSSPILAFLSTVPLIILLVINRGNTSSFLITWLNKISIGFIAIFTLTAIIQFLAVFIFGEVYA